MLLVESSSNVIGCVLLSMKCEWFSGVSDASSCTTVSSTSSAGMTSGDDTVPIIGSTVITSSFVFLVIISFLYD